MATYRKRGDKWEVRVSYKTSDGSKKQKSKSFKNKRDATKWAQETELYLKPGLDKANLPLVEYFTSWYELYKKPSVSHRTQMTYEISQRLLKKFFHQKTLSSITHDDVQLFVNSYSQGLTPFNKKHSKATVAKIYIQLKSCLRNAVRDGVYRVNPADDIVVTGEIRPKEERLKFLNESDQIKLRKYLLERLTPDHPVNFMILTALDTGMRLGELLGLTWDKISPNHINVNQAFDYTQNTMVTTKFDNPRKVAITQTLYKNLQKLDKRDYVFASYLNKPLSTSFVSREFKEIQKKSGIKKPINFHGLRHSHASLMLYKGMNIKALSKRLGHRDIDTTLNVYAHLIDEMEEQQIKLMEDAINDQYKIS